jgi:hypothetical protein
MGEGWALDGGEGAGAGRGAAFEGGEAHPSPTGPPASLQPLTLPPHFTRLPVISMTFVSWPSLPAPSMYISKR